MTKTGARPLQRGERWGAPGKTGAALSRRDRDTTTQSSLAWASVLSLTASG
jgi:hypothetical protein